MCINVRVYDGCRGVCVCVCVCVCLCVCVQVLSPACLRCVSRWTVCGPGMAACRVLLPRDSWVVG